MSVSGCSQIFLRCRITAGALALVLGAMFTYPVLMAENQAGASKDITADTPAVVRDFRGGATADKVMTIDFLAYGSDGLCVPARVCGGNLVILFRLPGEERERVTMIDEDGTYKGETSKYVLNNINMVEGDKTERACGFLPGEDYDPDPNVERPATRLANRLLLNPEALYKRFVETFEAVEGIRPVPTAVISGMEVYPQAPAAVKKKIIPPASDIRYYSRGASPHVKFLLFKDGKPVLPFGNHVVLSCIMWKRTEHTDFTAGSVVDLLGNRLPYSGVAAWGWQNGYGGLQYGDYYPGLGIHYFPALSIGESWDIRYNGNPHILGDFQQEAPCYLKPVIWDTPTYPGKAYLSESAPLAFGSVPSRREIDPEALNKQQQILIFGKNDPWYAPQDAFNYEDDKVEAMKWQRQGKGTARILRNSHFFQNGASLLFPGLDVPNSMRKPLHPDGLRHVTLTIHWFRLPEEGYEPEGSFLSVEFGKSPKLTVCAGANGALIAAQAGHPAVKTGLSMKSGWNPLSLIYDQESRRVYLRLGKDFAVDGERRMTFPADGGMTAMEIGKSAAPSERGNVLFDAIWINPNDNLSDNFEYASMTELSDGGWRNDQGATAPISLVGKGAYSGKQAVKFPPSNKPAILTRGLLADLKGHTVQIAWFREAKGSEDSFVEIRSADGKAFLRFRGNDEGKLLYRTQSVDWTATNARFRTEFLEGWNELLVIFDPEGNAYPILNLVWVAQENGLPLLVPACGNLSEIAIGRSGAPSGSDVLFDDLRLMRNWTLIGNATHYSSAFDYPLEPEAYFRQHGWKDTAAAGAKLVEGNAATGRRCLSLPSSANGEMSHTFSPELDDVTIEFSWCNSPEKDIRVDAGLVKFGDGKGNVLTLSADESGHVRYKANGQEWVTTEYALVKGWNKARVILVPGKPAEIKLAPQRAGEHPKSQWKRAWFTTEKDKVKSDFQTKTSATFTGLASVSVRHQDNAKGEFLFDDLVVLTNKPSPRDLANKGREQWAEDDLQGIDARLRSRFWPEIEKILVERGLLHKTEKK